MQILIVAEDRYPPFRMDVKVLFGEVLASRGHRIDWILQSERDLDRVFERQELGGTVWVGPTDNGTTRWARLRKNLRDIGHDLTHLRRRVQAGYDLIEVKDKFIAALYALWLTRRGRPRLVYWLSYPFPEHYLAAARDGTARYPVIWRLRGALAAFALYRLILPRADFVVVQSEQMRRDIAAQGIAPERMAAVPMGVHDTLFQLDLPAAPPADAPPTLVYLGTLIRMRQIDFVLRVFARVREHLPAARLRLIGAGADAGDEDFLWAEARQLGIDDAMEITGFLPQVEALRLTATAQVCLSPFAPIPILLSTSPTKLVEYLALGRPVVANDHPEQKQVLAQSGGGLCVPYDEQAFADAALEILRNPARAAAMGRSGRAWVRQHRSYSAIGDWVEGLYLRVIEGSANSAIAPADPAARTES